MLFRLAIVVLLLPVAWAAGVDDELAQAAKSPYDIARFVDTHVTFRWEPLWKALGLQNDGDVFIQPCGESGGRRDCFEELITILDPFQMILVLRHNLVEPEVYLRFLRKSGPDIPGPWTFGGSYSPASKVLRAAASHHPIWEETIPRDHGTGGFRLRLVERGRGLDGSHPAEIRICV